MLINCLIGAALIALTVTIHAVGTILWIRSTQRRHRNHGPVWRLGESIRLLILTGLLFVALHTVQVVLWAWTYLLVLPPNAFASVYESVYFSFVTFTTLGYGDITLGGDSRVLSGIEALNGILLVGWSTAVLFAIVQRLWQDADNRSAGD